MRARVWIALLLSSQVAVAKPTPHPNKAPPNPPARPMPQTEPDTLQVPDPEPVSLDAAVLLPGVPAFELPPAEAGFTNPRELRVKGKKLLDTDVKVKGYIIWIYDCVTQLQKPGESKAKVQKSIDNDPTQCERPKFYLGESKTTPPEKGLWVVDVPRAPNKLEKQRLPKAELKAWPKVPKLKLGDYVVVSGTFKLSSPHSERNSDGLVVFSAIEAAKPVAATAATTTQPPTQVQPLKPGSVRAGKPPLRPVVDPQVKATSQKQARDGHLAFGQKRYTEALTNYTAATKTWSGNHLAHYGMGGTYAAQGRWSEAFGAFERARGLRPDSAMYQLWAGVAAYERAVSQAREDEARKAGVSPDQVSVDLTSISFDAARERLDKALELEPAMWRAHFYRGRVQRAAGLDREAAASFTAALLYRRNEPAPWIALAELYRKWDYTDEAIVVAELGTRQVAANAGSADVFYVLGMAHDDKQKYDAAVAAYTRALELRSDHAKAMFQRGQAYFRLKKWPEAKADLEAFMASNQVSLDLARTQANVMLLDIATKKKRK